MQAILKTPPDMAAVARLSQDPIDHSNMRTTCVATRLDAGHANNALPQMAQANVNCRIVPGHSPEEIRQELEKVLADPKISVQGRGRDRRQRRTGSPMRRRRCVRTYFSHSKKWSTACGRDCR